MVRVLEYLEVVTIEDQQVYRCYKCGHILGPASGDYKLMAVKFDEPIWHAEPKHFAPQSDRYVLRHYCCSRCGVLFEVDMLPKEEEGATI